MTFRKSVGRRKVAAFLAASFVRLGSKSKPSLATSSSSSSTTTGGRTSVDIDDLEPQHGGKAGWDKEMEEKAEGWAKEWDEEKQRFYYVSLETLETTYTAPFAISVSLLVLRVFRALRTLRSLPWIVLILNKSPNDGGDKATGLGQSLATTSQLRCCILAYDAVACWREFPWQTDHKTPGKTSGHPCNILGDLLSVSSCFLRVWFCIFGFAQADRVEELREGAEVEYLRKVAAVKGESLLGLSDYRYPDNLENTSFTCCSHLVMVVVVMVAVHSFLVS